MPSQIKIENKDFFLSENLEEFLKREMPKASLKAHHSINQVELKSGVITTTATIESDEELINIDSTVEGTGMSIWLLVLLVLPFQMMIRYGVIDPHIALKIGYYIFATFIATMPGKKKADDWETARMRNERELKELLEQHNHANSTLADEEIDMNP